MQGSVGLKKSTLICWQNVPPYTSVIPRFKHKLATAASKYSPTSIMLKQTVASLLNSTTVCQFFSAHIYKATTSMSGLILCYSSSLIFPWVAFGRPTSSGLNKIYLFKFDASTTSLSSMMIFLTPNLASPIETPQPKPPTPKTKHTCSSILP